MIAERIRTIGISVIGKDHVCKNGVCQDRVFCMSKNGIHVISLCDGAGSRKNSHFGAEIVSRKAAEFLVENYSSIKVSLEKRGIRQEDYESNLASFKKKLVDAVKGDLEAYSLRNNLSIDELSCTLLFVAQDDETYIAGHIGDGVIGFLSSSFEGDVINVLSKPDNGASPNITYFINDKNSESRLRIYTGELVQIKGFILMSDGPEDALYDKKDGLSDNCKIIFEALNGTTDKQSLEFFEAILKQKISEVSYDDLSLNVMFRESVDTDETDEEEVLKDFLDDLSNNQIIRCSKYCVRIDRSLPQDGETMPWENRLKELKRRMD